MSGPAVFVGIDVAKATLDLAVRPSGTRWTVANEAASMPELVAALGAHAPTLVVLEATGGFEHVVVAALAAAGLPSSSLIRAKCVTSREPPASWPRPMRSMPKSWHSLPNGSARAAPLAR